MEPFTDVDVLDLTQSIAGPVATQLLGAMGANVVKVEPPGGDDFRGNLNGSMFASFNLGGKQSICVDLRTDDGQEAVRELAGKADVVVESFRPGVLEQFDLNYNAVCENNEDVVYCSITGFGHSGPYSDRPAYDPVLQAMSGLISTTGYPDRPPVRTGSSIIDCGTGTMAAFAITAGLLQRSRTGEGEHVKVSLFEVAVSWMAYWLANYSTTGESPQRSEPGGYAGLSPYGVFEADDDEQLYLSVVNDKQFRRLCEALGREELADQERYDDGADRWENREELYEILSDIFDEYDRDSLVDLLVDAGVPSGPVNDVEDVLTDPHVAERQLLMEVENLTTGEQVETAGIPIVTSSGRPDAGDRPPTLGEHTRTVLAEIGYSTEQIDRMIEAGAIRED